MDISGKTALITGGSKGIGYGIAEAMIHENINVLITSRHEDQAKQAAEALSAIGPGQCIYQKADVRNLEDQQIAVQKIIKTWGKLDVVIANAGVGHFAAITDISKAQWKEVIDTNLTGVFYTVKASLQPIIASQGYIITIGSLAGTNYFAKGSAYNASKFGLVGFTHAVMLDLRHHGVKVSTIMPGSVATYFNDHIPSEADQWKIQPEDIGELVIDLLKLPHRTLPSKIEVRPSQPPTK